MDPNRRRPSPAPSLPLALVAALGGAAAGWMVVAGRGRLAGAAVLLAGACGVLATATAERRGSARGAFVADAAERVLDGAVLGTVAWTAIARLPGVAAAALAALGTGGVVAYVRARGRGLGYDVPLWPWYRAGRTAVIGAGLIAGDVGPWLWAVLALDAGVGVARWSHVARQGEPG